MSYKMVSFKDSSKTLIGIKDNSMTAVKKFNLGWY